MDNSPEESQAAVQGFGEFMVKRLTEFHTEKYLREEPALRPIVETKEKLENVEIKVAPSYTVKLKYSLVGNYLQGAILNPILDSRIIWAMDERQFGPTEVQSTKVYLGKRITPKNYIETWAAIEQGQLGAKIDHRFNKTMLGYCAISSPEGIFTFGEIGMHWSY
jgi:hypothetical protein